jgi:microcystin-dependent protein
MPYIITKTDGTTLTTIADGSNDQTSSLTLAGPNYVGYGQELNQNLVYLLENFAGNTAPGRTNLQGQLWFDKFNQTLKVFTTQGYVPVSGVTNSTTQPVAGKNGDIWYNTSTEQMYLYDNSFKLVGPMYTRAQGLSGVVPENIEDGNATGVFRRVLKFTFGNIGIAYMNPEVDFVPAGGITGFPILYRGLTFSTNVAARINASIIGNVNGSVTGNLTGNVVASTLVGNLTGNVTGSVTGNVTATVLTGNLTGNTTTVYTTTTNFYTANAVVAGGYLTNLSNVSTSSLNTTTMVVGTGDINNLTTNAVSVLSGNISGITNLSVTNAALQNLTVANASVTGGTVSGLVTLSAATATAANLSTANILITGGYISSLTNISVATAQVNSLSVTNITATGGALSGLASLATTNAVVTNLTTGNIQATSGNVSNVTGANVTLSASAINDSTATTRPLTDRSTRIATTEFVHSVLPAGVIMMWNGTVNTIPTGWNLCDGSNGTPDLRGLFVVGAGGAYNVAATGGSNSVTLSESQMPVHTHTQQGTFASNTVAAHSHAVSDPGHRHNFIGGNAYGSPGTYYVAYAAGAGETVVYNAPGSITPSQTGITLGSAGAHAHTVAISGATTSAGGTSGTTQAHENRPPFYALCYIQKVS